ncbi:MAG: helix-turn-helix transcriptional regulator [Bacilli bacterium]|nr:helix-turn-helix transcriptional regulator [Bacilli bacterium]
MNNKVNNTNIYDTVRKNIRKYRKLKGMTQQDLADAAELSHGYIREIESLNMGVTFSLDAVEKIANALDLKFYLLFEEN